MPRASATIRICLALASVALCGMFTAEILGLVPDPFPAIVAGRVKVCETLAMNCAISAQRGDHKALEASLRGVKARNPEVHSVAVRLLDGKLLCEVGDHPRFWQSVEQSTDAHMFVPIKLNDAPWAQVEIAFEPAARELPWLPRSLRLSLFLLAIGFLGNFLYLRRVLHHLNPSNVIPERVRKTLDSLAEGLLVLDTNKRIVLANEAFADTVGQSPDQLQGRSAADLPWLATHGDDNRVEFPWERSIEQGEIQTDQMLKLNSQSCGPRVFKVNTAPIIGEQGSNRGALASFSDVTSLEVRNAQLSETLSKLKQSRDHIHQQNEQLRILATRDPLTGCLNRRAFFEELENQLLTAETKREPLSYLISDIDHFKSINDNHGHATGDAVLRDFASLLINHTGNRGLVARYGGEEFCVLLPQTTIEAAAQFAEEFRRKIAETPVANLSITASLGVAQFDFRSPTPRDAMEHADKSLYAAKRSGRNRVMRWDQVPADMSFDEKLLRNQRKSDGEGSKHIPFSAVSVLCSALQFRDPATAEHSRRVADMCVATARGLMSEEHRYVLEVAALLHDIGKLGVPDAILQKPSRLTDEERQVIRTHEKMGVRILENAFGSKTLSEIVGAYVAAGDGSRKAGQLAEQPLPVRILAIADAYDSMITDRPYRRGLSPESAFEELRRCAGTQFDAQLVERFIETVSSGDALRERSADHVTKHAALQIGLQIEKIACALDARDKGTLKSMANRLKTSAESYGVPEIVTCAGELERALAEDAEWLNVLTITTDLLDLCRLTQRGSTSVTSAG